MDLLKKASPSDDDIIDLTDIIEQGHIDSSAKTNADQEMETQMDSLFSKGNKEAQQLLPNDMDGDIDALLADMEAGTDADSPTDTSFAAPDSDASDDISTNPSSDAFDDILAAAASAQATPAPSKGKTAAPALNADETLDMPNMSEVDALLEGLDIPPQPDTRSAGSLPDGISDNIDDLLGDLLDGSSKNTPSAPAADAADNDNAFPDDLDALLAGAAAELDTPAAPKAAPAAPAAPEAPKAAPEAVPAPVSKASAGMDMDDLDALLAGAAADLDTPAAPKAAPAAAKAAPKAAPEAVPAPASKTSAGMDMDDLDALLAGAAAELDTPAAPKAAPVAAKAAPEAVPAPASKANAGMDMDDLDALLAGATAELDTPAAPKAAPAATAAPAAAPVLEDDVAKVLDAEPTDTKEQLSFDDELDSLLAEAATPSPTPKGGRNTTDVPSLEDDLDALFATVGAKADSDPAAAPDHAPDLDFDEDTPIDLSDLDDSDTASPEDAETLADIVRPTAKPKAAKAASKSVDDILAGLDLDTDPTTPSPVAPGELDEASKETFDEIATLMADTTSQELPDTTPAVDIAMVSMTDMTDMPDMPGSSPKDEEDLPELEALDALLQAANDAAPVTGNLPEHAPLADLDLAADNPQPDGSPDLIFTDEEIAQAAQELYDEKIMAEATTGEVDTDAWLDSLDEAIVDAEDTDISTAAIANTPPANTDLATEGTESIDQLLAHLPDDPENVHYVYRPNMGEESISGTPAQDRRIGESASSRAPSNFEKSYEQELARLQHITDRFAQSLAAADMHIAALTNTTANAVPPLRGLDDMLRQDSPFSTTLQSLVRNAVASELRAGPSDQLSAADTTPAVANTADGSATNPLGELHGRLDNLSTQMQNLQDRITALEDGNKEARLQTVETRVDGQVKTIIHLEERCKILEAHLEAQAKSQSNLENRFQYEVEKAAAAAAAKIIREEIAGILAGN